MKYYINANAKEVDEHIVVYNSIKAQKYDKKYKRIIKEIFSFFIISREETEIEVYAGNSEVINNMIREFINADFLKTEKDSYVEFSSIKILTSVSTKGNIYNLINQYILGLSIDEIIVEKIEDLDNKFFEKDLVIIYIPDNMKLLRDILLNYQNYNINKILIGIIWCDLLYYTFLFPPATACPKCFIESLSGSSTVFDYISSISNGNISYKNIGLLKDVLAPAILVNFIRQIKSMENDNLNPSILGNLNVYDFRNLQLKTQYIIKRYECDCIEINKINKINKIKTTYDSLVGDKVGLIKRIKLDILDQTFPPCVFLKASLPKSKKMVGALDFTWENAYVRTIGEFVERYCWENYSKDLFVAKWDELPKEKQISLETINRYKDWQYKKNINIKKLIESDVISWIMARNMYGEDEKYIPAEFVINYKMLSNKSLHYISSTGVAAGVESYDKIIEKAFFELIERDTITRNIYIKRGISKIHDPLIDENYHISLCKAYGLNVDFYYFSNDYGIHVIMCRLVSLDVSDDIISYGYACDKNTMECIIKSLKEALLMRRAILQDFNTNKSRSRFLYTARDSKNSFFENIFLDSNVSIKDIEKKEVNTKLLRNIKKETYFVDITLDNIKALGWSVISAYNPYMLDFAFNKEMLMLKNIPQEFERLNSGFMQF